MTEAKEIKVQVAVRVRPLLQKEKLGGEQLCVRVIPDSKQVIVGKDRAFTFDHVITSKSAQDEVYNKCVEPLVRSCFEGYNATVFAYGQTGSGKTFTIGGGNIASLVEQEFGIIPRAIQHIFNTIQTDSGTEYVVRVSYIELYKEELRDLLDVDTSSKDLHIREDEDGNTVISGTRELQCSSMDEVMSCLQSGSAARHTGSTQMNEQSSRSHSIFTIMIQQTVSDTNPKQERSRSDASEEVLENSDENITQYITAKFHFVDLAGSERVDKTGNVGDRFKESVHINSGLLALGNVISALGDPKRKVTHIPYRDSKITRLLKDSLGGNAKTLMICCISPASSNFDETLNSLKYANRARNIRNKPIVNHDSASTKLAEMQSEIMALRDELQKQRMSLYTAATETTSLEDSQVRELEDRIIKLQTECSHYRMVAEEAYNQLVDIRNRDLLSKSQNIKLSDWMELIEEIQSKVPSTLSKDAWQNETVNRLEKELHQCKKDLKSDEEIFAEKNKEVEDLKSKVNKLESMLKKSSAALGSMDEQEAKHQREMIQQQELIEQLQNQLKKQRFQSVEISQDIELPATEAPPITSRRAKSVPAERVGKRPMTGHLQVPDQRDIHTSPALFSLDRVMQGFRARSQLLINQLEDNDDVLHKIYSKESIIEEDDEEPAPVKSKTPFVRKGTFRVGEMKGQLKSGTKTLIRDSMDLLTDNKGDESQGVSEKLRSSTELQRKRIKDSQLKLQAAHQKMRDLNINIRMKEQLIRELVKSGKEAEVMKRRYADKLKAMEKDREQAKHDLNEANKALHDLEAKGNAGVVEKNKLQSEFRKKIESARSKVNSLQKKQKETEKVANITSHNDKKVSDLELAVGKMKQQHDDLHKRLKEENDRKIKLEKELQKDQQRIKELEIRNEQQQKVLKRKTEEVVAIHKKLRSGSTSSAHSEGQDKIDEQKKWLDGEIDKVLAQRHQMEALEEELKKREQIISKKEALMKEKSDLEMKKLRSSQILNKDILSVSGRLESMERKIGEKSREVTSAPDSQTLKEELQGLVNNRERLTKQRVVLEEKLQEGTLLSPQEERRLIEYDEAIETLDAAIDFKNERIANKQRDVRHSMMLVAQSEENILGRLNSLSGADTKELLSRYFNKIVTLKESERNYQLQCDQLEMKVDEQERLVLELESTLERSVLESDRKLTEQQQQYEQQLQTLVHQLATRGDEGPDSKMKELEKDLYYYKKTSRDLKKKLRELMSGMIGADGDKGGEVNGSAPTTPRDEFKIPLTPKDQQTPRRGSKEETPRENRDTPREKRETPRERQPHQPSTPRERHRMNTPRNISARDRDSKIDPKPPDDKPTLGGTRVLQFKEIPASDVSRNVTPIKISRRELRQMSEAELSVRRSNLSSAPPPQDSLEAAPSGGRNPWGHDTYTLDGKPK
ncbi:unnamed protein product [Owenia fusiformis]|uniref:Kinesin motor domain-containing protein n=1 Tax=Owenia fusiformis TaxID=6347 RepID=A0A8S4P0A2_OWEFU|nr:unnamed protein product [Owenia fusiformis]